MTQLSRTGSAVRLLAGLAMLAGLMLTGSLPTDNYPAYAAKPPAPPPPPPPPTGTIYYRTGLPGPLVYSAVKPDGSGQAADILPNIGKTANPAFSPSGSNAMHDRWWLSFRQTGVYDRWVNSDGGVTYNAVHHDLFAVRSDPLDRSQLIRVQLTDLYGIARITFNCWSNDGNNDLQNSFVTAAVYDLRDAFVVEADETTTVHAAQIHDHSLRLPLTISDIQPGFVPFGPESWANEAELDAMLLPLLYPAGGAIGKSDGQGAIAPSGNFCLRTPPGPGVSLIIEEWTQSPSGAPPVILVDGINGVPNDIWTAQWSPDGQTIAMVENGFGELGEGSIYTQPASGASAPKLVLNNSVKGQTITTYSQPIWSPDSKHLAVVKRQYNTGGALTGAWLTRLTLSDGKKLDLVPIADDTELLRWAADN